MLHWECFGYHSIRLHYPPASKHPMFRFCKGMKRKGTDDYNWNRCKKPMCAIGQSSETLPRKAIDHNGQCLENRSLFANGVQNVLNSWRHAVDLVDNISCLSCLNSITILSVYSVRSLRFRYLMNTYGYCRSPIIQVALNRLDVFIKGLKQDNSNLQ